MIRFVALKEITGLSCQEQSFKPRETYFPQVAQELDAQLAQAGELPATTRPPLWALNNEIKREAWSLSHWLQRSGASASFIDRSISNRVLQSRQIYS